MVLNDQAFDCAPVFIGPATEGPRNCPHRKTQHLITKGSSGIGAPGAVPKWLSPEPPGPRTRGTASWDATAGHSRRRHGRPAGARVVDRHLVAGPPGRRGVNAVRQRRRPSRTGFVIPRRRMTRRGQSVSGLMIFRAYHQPRTSRRVHPSCGQSGISFVVRCSVPQRRQRR